MIRSATEPSVDHRSTPTLKAAEVDVNVLCTIHAGNQDHPLDVYRFFRDEMGVRFIQFIPIVERTTETMLPIANIGWKPLVPRRVSSARPGGQVAATARAGAVSPRDTTRASHSG